MSIQGWGTYSEKITQEKFLSLDFFSHIYTYRIITNN